MGGGVLARTPGKGLSKLKVSVLGALEIQGVDPRALGSRKARTLIKVLAVARGQPVPVQALVERLWGDRLPARPSQQVSVLVSRLRAVLGSERLPRSDAGYHLRADWIDLDVAHRLAVAASRRLENQNYASARLASEAALALMRGELLADEPNSPWADEERAAVAQLATEVRRTAAQAALAIGDFTTARDMSEVVLASDPYDEASLRVLMSALAYLGQPGTALATFARARRRLRDDLGIDPSPATNAVHKVILQGKPISGVAIATDPKARRIHEGLRPHVLEEPEPILAGRAAQLTALDVALGGTVSDGVQVAVIEGESGIGKTRLLTHWATLAKVAGTIVLYARCAGLDRTIPLHPLVTVLDQFMDADRVQAQLLLGRRPAYRGLREAPSADPTPEVIAPALASNVRLRMFDIMFTTFRQLTARGPVALVLDDFHLAGDLTRAWVDFARARPSGVPLLIAIVQLPNNVLPSLVDHRVNLGPLDVAAAATLVGEERAADLHAVTGGNPLFLVQLAAADELPSLPATIRQAVDARCNQLGPAAHSLRTAAAIGPVVDPQVLGQILSLHPVDLFAHLEAGVRALFLDDGEGGFTFHHELVRETLAEGLTGPWRTHVRRTAARLLEARAAADAVKVARLAQLGGDATQAISALQVGARTCMRRQDYAEAERLLTDALDMEDSPDSRLQRAEARIAMGEYARAAEDARAAIVRGAGAAGMEIAAWSSYYLGDFNQARTLAEEGAALAESPGTKARCLVVAGRVLHSEGNLADAELRYLEAGALADESGFTALNSVWLAALRCDQGRAKDALQLLIGHGTAPHGDQPLAARHGHLARARALMMLGRVSEALNALDALDNEAGAQLAEGGPDGVNVRAAVLLGIGELDAADLLNQRALEDARSGHRSRPLQEASLLGLAESRLLAGMRRASARYAAEAARTRVGAYPFRWSQVARAHLLKGRLELAAGRTDDTLATARALLLESGKTGDEVTLLVARLLETQALVVAGESINTAFVGELLASAADVLGAQAWRLTAELAHLTGNADWVALSGRQLERVLQASGEHEDAARRFAEAFRSRLAAS